MNVIIGTPVIIYDGEKSQLRTTVDFENFKKDLYIEVNCDYADYFDTEIVDGLLVSILPYCMILAKDREVVIKSEKRISKRLRFQLERYFIPVIAKNISYYGNVTIDIAVTEKFYNSAFAIATGVSGGVDSSYSIACNLKGSLQALTHLVYVDLGIYRGFESKAEKVLLAKCQRIADDVDLPMVVIKTNMCTELYKKAYAPVVHSVFTGLILSMQKLFKTYYYSSTLAAEDFHFDEADAADYELFTLPLLSTDSLTFYSSGVETTRLEKVRFIADQPFVRNNLFVCLNVNEDGSNCNRCAKCTRTMCELEVTGKLDEFGQVFDIDGFRANPAYHWGYVLLKSWGGDPFYTELIKEKNKEGLKVISPIYKAAFKKFISRGFSTLNKDREKVWEIVLQDYGKEN